MTEGKITLEPLDWRFSAAIIGLCKYLEWLDEEKKTWELTEDFLRYDKADIQKSDYLKFAEYYYEADMHHRLIEDILTSDEITQAQIDLVNEKMKVNSVLQKVFKKMKFNGENKQEILNLINENRELIIEETFKNKTNLYKNYCNPNQFFKEGQECCRLNGYYVDMGKKGKSIAYNFNKANFVGEDRVEFDFIPFAFEGVREKFFINLNYDLNILRRVNNNWQTLVEEKIGENVTESGKVKTKQIFVELLLGASENRIRDVEVIVKDQDKDSFESLYIRKDQLDILRKIKDYHKNLCFRFPVREKYWIDIHENVFYAALNGVLLDETINVLLKNSADGSQKFAISQLIEINTVIKGKENMENWSRGMQSAFACAKQIAEKRDRITDNKLKSYCNKLINALVLDDYDRFQKVLINLSMYTEVPCGFAYDLFSDFEENKEIAYTFVNTLNRYEGFKKA